VPAFLEQSREFNHIGAVGYQRAQPFLSVSFSPKLSELKILCISETEASASKLGVAAPLSNLLLAI